MTKEIALYCMKAYSQYHPEMCEECHIYGQTGDDHCFEDALQYVISYFDALDKIRAEIDGIEINGQIDEHTLFIRSGQEVKKIVLEIIDKYRKGSNV